jgi:hypothetical protein
MTFFLNNKAISKLIQTKSLYSESKQLYSDTTSLIRIQNNDGPLMVQIVDARKQDDEEFSGISIYDGISELFCLINSDMLDKLKLKSGDIIIINEISCLNLEDEVASFKIAIVIQHCWHLGFSKLNIEKVSNKSEIIDENTNVDEEDVANKSEDESVERKTNKIEFETRKILASNVKMEMKEEIKKVNLFTHLIIDLQPCLGASFTIRAKLCQKTSLKDFTAKSGSKRPFNRFQFGDASAYIELCAFGEEATKYDKQLQIDSIYFISLADINTKTNFRAWPKKSFLCKYDLQITSKTKILIDDSATYFCLIDHADRDKQCELKQINTSLDLIKLEKKESAGAFNHFSKDTYNSVSFKRNLESTSMDLIEDTTCKKMSRMDMAKVADAKVAAVEAAASFAKKDKRIEFEDLLHQTVGRFYNLVGVLVEISEVTYLTRGGRAPLEIRKAILINKNMVTLSVAFWGVQAKKLIQQYQIGDTLMFLSAKLTNYGGISLSVERDTSVCILPNKYADDQVIELRLWWSKIKGHLKKDDYISINKLLSKMKNKNKNL